MLSKKIIKREISALDFLLMATSKVLIGIGIGLVIATHFYFAQPYWYLLILIGAIILAPTLYCLMKEETEKEIKLKKKL